MDKSTSQEETALAKLNAGELTMKPTGLWRSIVEKSVMINNDEEIIYTDHKLTDEEARGLVHGGSFSDVRLILCRPVFNCEPVPAQRRYNIWDKGAPKLPVIVNILDSCFRVKDFLNVWVNEFKAAPSRAVIQMLAHHYYDCMSGGCPLGILAILKGIIEHYDVDRNLNVYPKKGGWNTVADFLEEIGESELPDISFLFEQSIPLLPDLSADSQERQKGT